jgi:hypothetical protein
MGLTIHYRGKLIDPIMLNELIEDASVYAIENDWTFQIFDTAFENNQFTKKPVKDVFCGIGIKIPEAENLYFTFLSTGELLSLIDYHFHFEEGEPLPKNKYIHCKTQYAGYLTHQKIVDLLRMISQKYLTNFECEDESTYWNNEDVIALIKTFEKHENLINDLSDFLSKEIINEDDLSKNNLEDTLGISDNETPKLTLEDEINYKKMKLQIECNAIQINKISDDLPPELENQFLDYVLAFEKSFKDAKDITVHEKLGSPDFPLFDELLPNEREAKLDELLGLLNNINFRVDFIYEYENEDELLYRFITEHLFFEEVLDMDNPFNTCFIYEEFFPNHEKDLEELIYNVLERIFNYPPDFSDIVTFKNYKILKSFIESFEKFYLNDLFMIEYNIEEEKAIVKCLMNFDSYLTHTDEKLNFYGDAVFYFYKNYDLWEMTAMELPI